MASDKSYSGREFDWVIWVLCIDFELEHVGADLSSQMLAGGEKRSQVLMSGTVRIL